MIQVKEKIRVVIAGQGRSGYNIHASTLIKDLSDKFQVVAVADEIPGRCDDANKLAGAKKYLDYKPMLKAGGFDIFINALPQPWHINASIQALRAGYHVVCEKPISSKVKDFDKIVDAAKKEKLKFFPFQQNRFQPFFIKMQEIIDSGVMGPLIHVRSNWSNFARRWDWQTFQKNMGGCLLNTGPHSIDQAILLLKEKKPNVFCKMSCHNVFEGDAPDFCSLTLYGDNIPTIDILISAYSAYKFGPRYSVSCLYGGLTGNEFELEWRYFDPKKAPKQKMWRNWSVDRKYPSETLPWVENKWTLEQSELSRATGYTLVSLPKAPAAFYHNVYDVIQNNAKQIVTIKQVRQQLEIMEIAEKQNKLLYSKKNKKSSKS